MTAVSDNDGLFRSAGSARLGAIVVLRGVLSESSLRRLLSSRRRAASSWARSSSVSASLGR